MLSSPPEVVDEALLRTITAEVQAAIPADRPLTINAQGQAILPALGAAALPPPPSPATAAPHPSQEVPNLRQCLSSPSSTTAVAPSAAGK
ncbi:MAG: hypothetical protein FJ083_09110 [Cyanobacteria bacterium K_Offshore_surface_m2_239]|nr:hypothetical protein [Cyanobacteria bacterium K_Offshore_surface_m2_239]